ncbi:glutathione S-transferase family protein [Terrarubrum flagellatum]|uniref:glutathione S-transferase family protein n=1 Tax=Terrirubrum flagellatum TaxID=2895980 RepID=UPI0031457095
MPDKLQLISHALCPYVQRAVIALTEKNVPFERIDIDLANKPDWFKAISPLGKVPLLRVGETSIFESAVIVEYLEETTPHPLHPKAPLARAEHRGWIEFSSAILADLWGYYTAKDTATFDAKTTALADKFAILEKRVKAAPWFDGADFSLVDAAFGPVFRYFDVLDRIVDHGILDGKPKLELWRASLSQRPSVRNAVAPDYPAKLEAFIGKQGGVLAQQLAKAA